MEDKWKINGQRGAYKVIESAQNKLIKEIKSLSDRKNRDEKGLFIADGLRFVSEIPQGMKIDKFIFSEGFAAKNNIGPYEKRAVCYVISDRLFSSVSDTKNPQGIMAVCEKISYRPEDIIRKNGFYVIAEELNDPGNLGTIIRTAHAAGADGVILSKGSVDLYNPKVLRSTMGSIFKIPVVQNADLEHIAGLMKKSGIKIYAAHLRGEKYPYELDLKKGCAFMLGNEARGLSDRAASLCHELVKIPMPGNAESLNASVAAAVLIYEAVRQRIQPSI